MLIGMQLRDGGLNASSKEFELPTAIINSVAIVQFFKAYTLVFSSVLAARSTKDRLFGPVLTYFRTIKTNSQGILHLHLLV